MLFLYGGRRVVILSEVQVVTRAERSRRIPCNGINDRCYDIPTVTRAHTRTFELERDRCPRLQSRPFGQPRGAGLAFTLRSNRLRRFAPPRRMTAYLATTLRSANSTWPAELS
jgi:hypothetical protein